MRETASLPRRIPVNILQISRSLPRAMAWIMPDFSAIRKSPIQRQYIPIIERASSAASFALPRMV